MGDLAMVLQKVETYLKDNFGDFVTEGEGTYSLRQGSAKVTIRALQSDDDEPVYIRLRVPLLTHVPNEPELHQYVAFHSDDYLFGHLSLRAGDEDGYVDVGFTYTLLGDDLDESELVTAVASVAVSADSLDDLLQGTFGGNKFFED